MDFFLEALEPGMVLTCRVTRLEPYGAFLDIGCGIVAILPIELMSVSRIGHPGERVREGEKILAAVRSFDRENRRITMTMRELLGTWMENASRFAPGETVRGVVRSVKDYGSFIELTPNLSGLAEPRSGYREGERVSVYIKSILPQQMKLKLLLIDHLPPETQLPPLTYFQTEGVLERWRYAPTECAKAGYEVAFSKTP